MPWGAVIGAIATYAGSENQKNSAKAAGKDASKSSQAQIDEQRREYDQSRADQLPWLTAGTGALADMGALNSGDFSKFTASPDYQFTLDQGLKLSDRSAASHGALGSGGHSADLMALGQGLASQQYNNFYNKLQSLAGQGQTTASGLGQLGQNMASNIGNALQYGSNARQSSYINQGNASANAWNQYGQIAGNLAGYYNGYGGGYG